MANQFWNNPQGTAAIKKLTKQGYVLQPRACSLAVNSDSILGLWFPENNKQPLCHVPDLWLVNLDELCKFAEIGRKAWFELEQRRVAYCVDVEFANGKVERFKDNRLAREAIVVKNDLPVRITGLNPFSNEVVAEYRAYRHTKFGFVLRPADEIPPRMPTGV